MAGRKGKATVTAPAAKPPSSDLVAQSADALTPSVKESEVEEQAPTQTVPAAPAPEEQTPAPAPAGAENNEEEPMQNSIQKGRSIDYTPAADVTGGDLIVFPAMVAVASTDIPADTLGALEAEGVFDLPKDGTALAVGQAVYATAAGVVTATAGGNTPAGKAWADASGGDDRAQVKINA